MLEKVLNIERGYLLLIPGLIALIPFLYFINMSFLGDDYTWLLYARENQNQSIIELFTQNGPFNYYRPVAVIFMNLLYYLFSDNVVWYRLVCGVFYSGSVILLFLILERLNFERLVSLITVTLFAVISAHSEVIFMVNCINIIMSDFLILCGLYLFLGKSNNYYKLLTILLFLIALLFRESAVYYIFLIVLFHLYSKRKKQTYALIINVIPIVIYVIIRVLGFYFYQHSFSNGRYYMHLEAVKIIYKLFHFFVISIFPIKSLFHLIGFEFYDNLRQSLVGADRGLLFYIILSVLILIFIPTMVFVFRAVRGKVVFPALIFLFCIIVYLPAENVAERFTYLASFGTSLMVVLFAASFKKRSLSYSILMLFIILHFSTLILRGYTYTEFSVKFSSLMINADATIPAGAVKIQNTLQPFKGQMLISSENFNNAFKYIFPENKTIFVFENYMTKKDSSYQIIKEYVLDKNELILIEK